MHEEMTRKAETSLIALLRQSKVPEVFLAPSPLHSAVLVFSINEARGRIYYIVVSTVASEKEYTPLTVAPVSSTASGGCEKS